MGAGEGGLAARKNCTAAGSDIIFDSQGDGMKGTEGMTRLKLMKATDVEAGQVRMEGAVDVTMRMLISGDDGAPNFAMRLFEVGPAGRTPYHSHDWEHEIYIVEGKGKIVFGEEEKPFEKGDFIFVPGGNMHSFINTGAGKLQFLCLVPVD